MVRAAVALVVVALFTSGCAVGPDRCAPRSAAVAAPTMPPAPLSEIVTAAPAPSMTFIGGYWHWDAVRWVWVPGHWVTPPPGQRWAAARSVPSGDHVMYHPGEMTCAAPNEDDRE